MSSCRKVGAILNQGTLTLDGCAFLENSAQMGGAIENPGTLSLVNCTFRAARPR